MTKEKLEWYREQAKLDYRIGEGDLEVDDEAVVSESEGGAYVQCWMWVEGEEGREGRGR
jgi:hypothetical protein